MQIVDENTLLEDSDVADAKIEAAMQSGVRRALREHKQRGNTVVIWRDGEMVLLSAQDIHVTPTDDDLHEGDGEAEPADPAPVLPSKI